VFQTLKQKEKWGQTNKLSNNQKQINSEIVGTSFDGRKKPGGGKPEENLVLEESSSLGNCWSKREKHTEVALTFK
jgi:hypothetical protein